MPKTCPICNGSGTIPDVPCECNGRGGCDDGHSPSNDVCPGCGGSGTV